MNVKLWDSPYNGGWIWFSRANLNRCQLGLKHENWSFWWAIFGFSGAFVFQSWPWQRRATPKLEG